MNYDTTADGEMSDEEINLEVAHALGWHSGYIQSNMALACPRGSSGRDHNFEKVPLFATDLNAAVGAVLMMWPDRRFEIRFMADKIHRAYIENEVGPGFMAYEGEDKSAARAVCLAFLAASKSPKQ